MKNEVPLIIVDDFVPFPGAIIDWQSEDPIFHNLVQDIISENEEVWKNLVGVVAKKNELEHYSVGVLAKILSCNANEETGFYTVKLRFNEPRFKIIALEEHEHGYLIAKIILLKDKLLETEREKLMVSALLRKIQELWKELLNYSYFREDANRVEMYRLFVFEIGRFIDFSEKINLCLYFLSFHIGVPESKRQEILEATLIPERLRKIINAMPEAIVIEEYIRNVARDYQEEFSKLRREDILRHFQDKMNRDFGEKGGKIAGSHDQLRKKYQEIKDKIPAEAQKEIEHEFARLNRDMHSSEASMVRDHLELLIDLPWGVYTEDSTDLRKAQEILDKDHYGLMKVKERILEYLAVYKHAPRGTVNILCFVGPPGVGKTSLGESIARALGRKFVRLSLGGLRDEADIRGHGGTYINAKAGQIIQHILKTGSANPVFMLDEVDKMSQGWKGDPAAALLEVLDPEQNKEFFDFYANVHFDLSRVFFICTANSEEPILPALCDRMEIIGLSGYTSIEKLMIVKNHLIPKVKKLMNFPVKRSDNALMDVLFTDGAIMRLIEDYTREAGVRNIQRKIETVFRKITKMAEFEELRTETDVLKITEQNLHKYTDKPEIYPEQHFEKMPPGCVPMFAVSEYGGHFFYVEAMMEKGRTQRKIKVTGVRGSEESRNVINNLIEESIDTALDSLILEGGILCLTPEERQSGGEYYIHVHVRDGASPKDGPSAGVPMLWSMYSLLTNQSIQSNIGATGEIDLSLGVISPVGGIRDKALAAYKAGIKKFIIPKANERNLEDVPSEIKEKMEIVPVLSVWETLKIVFPNDQRITQRIEIFNKNTNPS